MTQEDMIAGPTAMRMGVAARPVIHVVREAAGDSAVTDADRASR